MREQSGSLQPPLFQRIEIAFHTLREAHADWTPGGKEKFLYIMRNSISSAFDTARTADIAYLSDTKRYLVGPAFELRFPLGLGIEFDALYKRLNYESTAEDRATRASANSWEFPLLFKLRASSPGIGPFIVAGPSFRHLSDLRQFISTRLGIVSETPRPAELENRFSSGFAVGGGLEIGGRFRFVPEIRYTRWAWENFRSPFLPEFRSSPNQLDFLLGIHF